MAEFLWKQQESRPRRVPEGCTAFTAHWFYLVDEFWTPTSRIVKWPICIVFRHRLVLICCSSCEKLDCVDFHVVPWPMPVLLSFLTVFFLASFSRVPSPTHPPFPGTLCFLCLHVFVSFFWPKKSPLLLSIPLPEEKGGKLS